MISTTDVRVENESNFDSVTPGERNGAIDISRRVDDDGCMTVGREMRTIAEAGNLVRLDVDHETTPARSTPGDTMALAIVVSTRDGSAS